MNFIKKYFSQTKGNKGKDHDTLSTKGKMSLVTYNVWFDALAFDERFLSLMNIIKNKNADFVCLQEVTPRFMAKLNQNNEGVLDIYECTAKDPMEVNPYGVIILYKKSLASVSNIKYKLHDLPSRMYRKLLVIEITDSIHPLINENINNNKKKELKNFFKWHIGTVHLESLGNQRRRREQLEVASNILGDKSHAILCGDFNFCSYRNYFNALGEKVLENEVLNDVMPQFTDIWPYLHNVENNKGYTFDSSINKMIKQREIMRYDRIVAKLSEPVENYFWEPIKIEILGNEPINEYDIFPSDHFGLYAEFKLKFGSNNYNDDDNNDDDDDDDNNNKEGNEKKNDNDDDDDKKNDEKNDEDDNNNNDNDEDKNQYNKGPNINDVLLKKAETLNENNNENDDDNDKESKQSKKKQKIEN